MKIVDNSQIGGPAGSEEVLGSLEQKIVRGTTELLETNKRLQQEISYRKRAEKTTRTLFSITNAISTTKDLKDLYASIHSILGEVVDVTNFYIAIYYKDEKRVSFPYFVDQFDSGDVYTDQFSEENSLTGTVITTKRALFINESQLKQRGEEKSLIGTVPTAWMGVPLKIKNEVIGIMAAQGYGQHQVFDILDQEIFISVSDQIALAIERKRNEQAIIASEEKYRNIIECIEDGYYEFNIKGNLIHVNQAISRMLGYSPNELLGMTTTEFMSEKTVTMLNESFNNILETETPGKVIELELLRKDGDIRYAETVVSVTRGKNNQPTGYRGIARDITQRKNTEKSQKALEEKLQQSQRLESLGTLAGGIAHDFNNLLMGIQGQAEIMRNNVSKEHPHYEKLASIKQYVDNAAGLTTRLLGFARGGKYEVQPVDLNSIVEQNIQMFGRTKKEITINSHLEKYLKPIEADSNQIQQILMNLLVNAGQAMPEGGTITIETSQILVGEDKALFDDIPSGLYVKLTVTDTGKGIEEEAINKIFDPFFTTKPIGQGSGLGLAMVYGIISNHSGSISVESRLNQGSTFTILLPLSEKEISTITMPSISAVTGSETILLVDDEPMIIEVVSKILSRLGYDVLTAVSGQEAIEKYIHNQDRIDLLIIDMIMPQMSGGELFDRLKKINPTVSVMLSSGYSVDGEAQKILERGCNGFIQKPFSRAQLSEKIRAILM